MSHFQQVFRSATEKRKRLNTLLFVFISLSILTLSLILFALSAGTPYMGIELTFDEEGWVIYSVDENGAASEAGIKVGDRPTEINYQPAETFFEQNRELGSVYFIATEQLEVTDSNGQVISVITDNETPSWQSTVELGSWFFSCLIFWIVGFYVYFKKPGNTAALLLCLCGLIFGLALSANMATERMIPASLHIAVTAATIGPWILLHFFLVLPEERAGLRSNPLIYLIYLPALITIALYPFIGYADGHALPEFRLLRVAEYGLGFLAIIGVVFFNYLRSASPKTRQQMKIVLIGSLVAIIPFLTLNVLPEVFWKETVLPAGISNIFISLIPLGMGYAVINQKLMDIDVVIRRGVIYGLVTLVMAAALSAAILLAVSFQDSLGTAGQVTVALVLGGIATLLFGPTKRGIELLVDKFLYKDRYDYRQIIQSTGTAMQPLTNITDISRLTVGTTVQTLNLAGACLLIKTQAGPFEIAASQGIFTETVRQTKLQTLISNWAGQTKFINLSSEDNPDIAFLIPLVAGEKVTGILFISPKISRQDFSTSDTYLLHDLAAVTAIALRSAMLLQDVSLRDTFVSVASHELRTPLTNVTGYAELLMHKDPPLETRQRWAKSIYKNSQKLADMVDNLLNVSRIRSGKMPVKQERIKLVEALEEWLAVIKENADKHKFIINIEPGLPEVYADQDKLGQVIINLLSNAVKYSPNGGNITISARDGTPKKRIIISIADEGIGISREDRKSLFTTFHRIHRPETIGIGGSGLGLYIVKEWTKAMGGEIWLKSELNKGSTFFVGIPIQTPDSTN